MNIIKTIFIATVLVSLISCCGCNKSKSKNALPLTQTKWTLVKIDGKDVVANDNYYVIFGMEEGRFNGRGDCNSMFGTYTAKDGKIEIKGVGSTRALCAEQQMEDEFFKDLQDADAYTIDGKMLMFLDDGEVELIFEAK